MAIYRCNKCGFLEEGLESAVGSQRECPTCGQSNPIYDTLFFIRRVLEKYFALVSANKRQGAEAQDREIGAGNGPSSLEGINLHNTDQISTDLQHGPIHDWFETRKIQIRPNYKAVDTTGFFDEVAVEIGREFEILRAIVDQIRFAQIKNYTFISVNLSKRSQKEQQQITTFCRQLYDYSFVSKYSYQKTEKIIRLNLQNSPQIRDFFAGEWLEWHALMEVLAVMQATKPQSACARSLSVVFPNEDLHELDVFVLLGGRKPVCIECKTGEFRPYIDKYSTLRKRLGLEREQFIICVAGLPDDQAAGLTSMFDLTFLNQQSLKGHLSKLASS